MATPTGPPATKARGWHARERRRLKQNENAFAALVAAPHDFGSQAAGVGSPNNLALPANARFAVSHSVGLSPEDFSLTDIGPPEIGHDNAETTNANGIQTVRNWYEKDTILHVFRRAGSPAGTLSLFFLGPNNARSLIATATWT